MTRRRLALVGFVVLALAGGVSLQRGCVARVRFDPATVTWGGDTFRIVERAMGQTGSHDLVRDGAVVATLAVGLDSRCDHPWLALFDLDGDGRLDLYQRHCRGHRYLRYQPATQTFEEVDLGTVEPRDAPVLDTFWGREVVRWHGLRLIALGLAGLVVGLVGTIVTALGPSARRRADAASG